MQLSTFFSQFVVEFFSTLCKKEYSKRHLFFFQLLSYLLQSSDLCYPDRLYLSCRECSFVHKAMIAESIGARAVIINDNDPDSDEFYVEMISDNTKRDINIPVAFLVGKNG